LEDKKMKKEWIIRNYIRYIEKNHLNDFEKIALQTMLEILEAQL